MLPSVSTVLFLVDYYKQTGLATISLGLLRRWMVRGVIWDASSNILVAEVTEAGDG